MTPDAKHGFNNMAYGRIKTRLESTDNLIELVQGTVYPFLPGWATGRILYATLFNPSGDIEIVKVTDISDHRLTVVRGQDGTVARVWPVGSVMTQRAISTSLNKFKQKGEFRTVSYNPDSLVVANFPGEKIYQDGANACEKRWFINRESNGVDRWGPLAANVCDWEYLDPDGYIQIGPWTDRTDDTYWTCVANCLPWNGTYWTMSGIQLGIRTIDVGTYWAGYRPTYVVCNFEEAVTFQVSIWTGTDYYSPEGSLAYEANYVPGELLKLDWTGLTDDILKMLFWPNTGYQCHVNEIKFVGAY